MTTTQVRGRVLTWAFVGAHPACRNANLCPVVEGPTLAVSGVHAKVRRDGYRSGREGQRRRGWGCKPSGVRPNPSNGGVGFPASSSLRLVTPRCAGPKIRPLIAEMSALRISAQAGPCLVDRATRPRQLTNIATNAAWCCLSTSAAACRPYASHRTSASAWAMEPEFVSMSEEEHQEAVAVLADLLAAYWLKTRRRGTAGTFSAPPAT